MWSGIKGHKWSTALRDIISGKQVPQTTELAIQSSPAAFSGGTSGGAGAGPTSTALGGSATKNKAIAAPLATAYGWGPGTSNWSSLIALWTRESGWDNHARNPTSGAYGIPQALPPSKMGTLANPPISSAGAQITWGLRYIKGRYGDPNSAEAHENAQGWY